MTDTATGARGATLGVAVTLAIMAFAVWIYWPGASGPALLDDRSSVAVIGDLQAAPAQALDYIFGDASGPLGRSVSMASFVFERLYLTGGIATTKQVNILLHAINGGLFIWLLALLLGYTGVRNYRGLAIALGAVWLLHPLLVSTVLYAVQRMAMLATFFMLLAALCFVYWRLALLRGAANGWRLLPVAVLFALGLFAKENAIVLIPLLLLLEILWFQFEGPRGQPLAWLRRLCYVLFGLGVAALLLVALVSLDYLQPGFATRPFTLGERLLTETRIVWDYVGQWFWPEVTRMGLYHDDVILSRTLLQPVATLYAVLAWLLVAALCLVLLRTRAGRWLVFGVAWFLVGHSLESTVVPLELYFEHRNYFPAMGLTLLVGAASAVLGRRWSEPIAPLVATLAMVALVLAALTSSQVQLWSSRPLLVLSHLNGHPASPRANTDMAEQMASLGQIEAALDYSARAFTASAQGGGIRERQGDFEVRNLALYCVARAPVPPGLIQALGRTDPDRPLSSVTTLLTTVRLLQDNHCPAFDREAFAARLAEIFLVADFQHKASANMFSNLAVLENAIGRYTYALQYAQRFLALSPDHPRGLLMQLHFATALGRADVAEDTVARLQALQQQGKLTLAEQNNLALYLEH